MPAPNYLSFFAGVEDERREPPYWRFVVAGNARNRADMLSYLGVLEQQDAFDSIYVTTVPDGYTFTHPKFDTPVPFWRNDWGYATQDV